MACYTRKQAKELWDYAKEFHLKTPGPSGYLDFKELTRRLSDDLYAATGGKTAYGKRVGGNPGTVNLVPEEIAKLLATPKTVKVASKNLLMTDRNRAYALNQARNFQAGTEKTPLSRFITGVYQAPYAGKTVGHSAALHMTHAWPYAYDPAVWKDFGKSWVDSWKAMSDSNAKSISQRIMLDPNFDEQMSSGLAVDPRKIYDDVQQRTGFFGKLGRMTSNSFLGLKELRQMQWNAIWDRVPDHLKTDEMRRSISLNVNHMTGAPGAEGARALSGKFGKVMRGVFFAPSLDVSRVMRPVDLVKSMGIGGKSVINKAPVIGEQLAKLWGTATPESRWLARQNMKQWARIAAVKSAILYGSHLLLKNFYGSDEDVNIDDPFKSDWMVEKAPDGSILQATGGQIPMIRTAINVVGNPKRSGDALGNYIMGKINPALSIGRELQTGKGFRGEDVPAPFGEATGVGSWAEFLTAELGPIATEEGIHEFAKQMSDQTGIDEAWHMKFLKAFGQAALVTVPAVAGTHYYQPTPIKTRGRKSSDMAQ